MNKNVYIKGGSWLNRPSGCRSAFRSYYTRADIDNYIGFRIVKVKKNNE